MPLAAAVEFLDHIRKPITASERRPGPYPYYGANGQQDSVAQYLFDEPLVLLAEDGGYFDDPARGVAYGVTGKCWVNNHAHVLRPKADFDFGFLRWHLAHYDLAEFVNGTTRAKLTKGAAERIPLLKPPLPEQRRIADILDKADAIRRKRKEAIALTEELLRSAFLDMFGDPVTNPKGWPSEAIDDLCERGASLVDGPFGSSLKPEHYVSEGVKVVRNWNIYDDRFDSGEFKYVTRAKFEEIRRSEVVAGDILITTKGTVGDVCVAPDLGGPAVLSASGTVRLRLPADCTYIPAFVVAQMTMPSFKRYLHTFEAGSAQQYLNLSAIKKMRLVRPSPGLQQEFSTLRERVRAMVDSQRSAMALSESIFDSLVQRAFAGRLASGES